jgi:hypothetical protein
MYILRTSRATYHFKGKSTAASFHPYVKRYLASSRRKFKPEWRTVRGATAGNSMVEKPPSTAPELKQGGLMQFCREKLTSQALPEDKKYLNPGCPVIGSSINFRACGSVIGMELPTGGGPGVNGRVGVGAGVKVAIGTGVGVETSVGAGVAVGSDGMEVAVGNDVVVVGTDVGYGCSPLPISPTVSRKVPVMIAERRVPANVISATPKALFQSIFFIPTCQHHARALPTTLHCALGTM